VVFGAAKLEDIYASGAVFINTEFKTKQGLVYTPYEVAKRLIDKIPVTNPETVCVPNALNGIFAMLAQARWPNAKVVCLEYYPYFRKNLASMRFAVVDGDGVKNMKFDVIVGNPPYQDVTMGKHKSSPLWIRIVGKSFELLKDNGYLAMVTPSSWMSPSKAFDAIYSQYDLQSVDLTAKRHFNVGSTFSAWVLRKAPTTRQTLFVTEDGEAMIDWKGMMFLPHIVNPVTVSLTRKFFFREGPKFSMQRNDETDTRTLSKERTTEFRYRVFHTNAQTELWARRKNGNHDVPKVMMTLSGYQIPIYSDDCGTSQIVIYLEVKNAAEGKRIIRILTSKLYNVMIETLGKYGNAWGLNRVLFSLPAVDRSIDWTDEALYKHFGLTKAEIAYVEANAK
jgi:hypothetical protein